MFGRVSLRCQRREASAVLGEEECPASLIPTYHTVYSRGVLLHVCEKTNQAICGWMAMPRPVEVCMWSYLKLAAKERMSAKKVERKKKDSPLEYWMLIPYLNNWYQLQQVSQPKSSYELEMVRLNPNSATSTSTSPARGPEGRDEWFQGTRSGSPATGPEQTDSTKVESWWAVTAPSPYRPAFTRTRPKYLPTLF